MRRILRPGLGAMLVAIAATTALAQEDGLNYMYTLPNAAAQNKLDDVQTMLRRGDSPNVIDPAGRSPLDYAATFGNMAMIEALLGAGARLDFRDQFGNTALHWAAESGQIASLRRLLAAQAPVDAPNKQGVTPLMLAADANKVEAVRVLLASGADPKKQDFTGRDALGWAAGRPGALRMLQQAPAH
jgi:uncharacterized protein